MRKDTIPEYSITVIMNVKNAVIVTHFCLSLIRVIKSTLMKSTNNFHKNSMQMIYKNT